MTGPHDLPTPPTNRVAGVTLPVVTENEDGDYFWLLGHLGETECLLAVALHLVADCTPAEAYRLAMDSSRERSWWRQDPDKIGDDDGFVECFPTDPGATAYTIVAVSS